VVIGPTTFTAAKSVKQDVVQAGERLKVYMSMSNLGASNNRYDQHRSKASIDKQLDASRDMLAEELLNNITATPIGRLLRQIAEMPEIRQEKVSIVRNKINRGEYDLNEHLDFALDRVLEELIT
jgi:hypothetical protein